MVFFVHSHPRPFGLSLSKPGWRTATPPVRAELVEAWLARPRPFGLTLRRGSGQGPPAADRSSVPACACGSCSLREAAPGFRPGSRPPFLYRQERRQRSDPCRLGPRVARAALRCSVFAPAPNSLRSLRSLRSDKRREVSSRSALARAPQSPALLSSSEGGDEHQIQLASHRQDDARFARARCEARRRWNVRRSRTTYCSWAPWEASRSAGVWGRVRSTLRELTSRRLSERSERSERSELGAGPEHRAPQSSPARAGPPPSGRLFFGDFLLAKQKFAQRGVAHFAQRSYANTKVTALSGAHPDAASRSEQEIRESRTRLRSAAGEPCPEPRRRVSPNGWGHAHKASTGSARTDGAEWPGTKQASTSSARTGKKP